MQLYSTMRHCFSITHEGLKYCSGYCSKTLLKAASLSAICRVENLKRYSQFGTVALLCSISNPLVLKIIHISDAMDAID